MKFTLAILVVLAVASPLYAYKIPSTGSGELAKDFQDLIDLIPLEKMVEVTKAYAVQDKDFQSMVKLVKSSESKEFVLFAEQSPVFKKLMAYVQNNGLDIYALLNLYNKHMDLPPYKPLSGLQRKITGGVNGYVVDIAELVPMNDLLKMMDKKLATSKAMQGLVSEVQSPEFLEFFNSLLQNEHYLALGEQAEQIGIKKDVFLTYYEVFLLLVPLNK